MEELMLGDLNLIPSFPEFSKIDTGENLIHTGPLLYEGQRNKVNFKAIREAIKVFGDATILFPLIVAKTFARR